MKTNDKDTRIKELERMVDAAVDELLKESCRTCGIELSTCDDRDHCRESRRKRLESRAREK